MRRVVLACALSLLAVFARAQSSTEATLFAVYDADATDPTYGKFTGVNGDAFGAPIRVNVPIETSGSSTTVTAVTASSAPFASVGVGDMLLTRTSPGATQAIRYVTARASADSITVNSAINLDVDGGVSFDWRDFTSGTTSADGWVTLDKQGGLVVVHLTQINATSVIVNVQGGKSSVAGTIPVPLYPDPADTATDTCHTGVLTAAKTCSYRIPKFYDAVRVGLDVDTDDGGDTGANAEIITVTVTRGVN